MPNYKENFSQLTVTKLAQVTGVAKETARRRLDDKGIQPVRQDGRSLWYEAPVAVAAILKVGEGLSPAAEKARLDKLRADIVELDLAQRRGELIESASVEFSWIELASTIRAHVLALPSKLAQKLAAASTPAECNEILELAVYEALDALAGEGDELEDADPDGASAGGEDDALGAAPSPEEDGARVG